jgi:hypothetical protein
MTKMFVGKKITAIRQMTVEELDVQGWEVGRRSAPLVIVLDDGSKIFASRDGEGNGPGVLFGEVDYEGVYVGVES